MTSASGPDRTPLALVTGATGGIGRAIVAELAAAGWAVLATGRDASRLARTAEAGGERVQAVAADLREPEGRERVVAAAGAHAAPVRLLVNNAGVAAFGPAGELSDEDVDDHLAVNVGAPIRLVRDLLPLLRRAGRADVVNVASEQILRPGAGNALYGATKAALAFLTRAWAAELAPDGIRVNCLLPGAVDTDLLRRVADPAAVQVPLGRLVSPVDVARWVVHLTAADSVTGAVVAVDGGTSLT
jgi:NAD(P)-dependent dehydrogenase (short-subunit alcohol dehydrogenase family)